ncbi:MAG TPA: SusD/RagB family nutrient-binding outer membrane lipoprotein [Puia sp.]|nr:SusD/RagB family nutrient-binding outer membrane lipoprotein [Puia sp.]
MKKNIFYLAVFCSSLLIINSCKKKLSDDYLNPESTTTASVDKLFTTMLTNPRIHPTYYDYATFVTGVTAKYSQMIGIVTDRQMYVPSPSYSGSRWSDYYAGGIVNQYFEMLKNYNKIPESQQGDHYIFMQLAKIIYYDQTAQIIDLWGDIPFSEAGSLDASNTLVYPKYEDAASIYDTLINGLKDLNNYLSSATLSSAAQNSLKLQDILLNGDLNAWRLYVNSLRLRLLMRISNVNETFAKTEITAMLNDPATFPVVDDNSKNILLRMKPSTFISDIHNGLADGASSSGPYAPSYLLDTVMVGNNDPRTDVFWDKGSANSNYQGLSPFTSSSDQSTEIQQGKISTFDSATFMYNYNVPGVLFTAAETSFLRAEAYERWGLGDAQTEYENGIKQSIAFYYSINQSSVLSSGSWNSLATPNSASIMAYISGSNIAYSGTQDQKLSKIATQKWINFFVLQAGQAWAEMRRTKYPKLNFAEDAAYPTAMLPPSRLLYPEEESVYNTANYNAVKSKDTRDTKIFWDVK